MAKKILFETALTDTDTVDVEGIGSEREDREGNKYRWVYNASTTAARVGGPACYDAGNYSSVNFRRHVLSNPTDEDILFFAGVFLSAIPTLNYGWIKTYGLYNTCRQAVGTAESAAINDLFVVSTLVDTSHTAASCAYSFITGQAAAATGAVCSVLTMPFAFTPVAVATSTALTGTIPHTIPMFIKGM